MDGIHCILTKISDNPNNLRTKEVIGECVSEPKIGQRFEMISEPITEGASLRFVTTSPVQKLIKKENGIKGKTNYQIIYDVETLNSSYRIELFP